VDGLYMDLGLTWTAGDGFVDRRGTLDCGKCLDSLKSNIGLGPLRDIPATVTAT
jgi:hypothetical protein